MRNLVRKFYQSPAPWLIGMFFLANLAADTSLGQPRARSARGANPKIKLGEVPPEFKLPRLTLDKDKEGNPIGIVNEKDTVRLSVFRGKKPVCLIMSSYT